MINLRFYDGTSVIIYIHSRNGLNIDFNVPLNYSTLGALCYMNCDLMIIFTVRIVVWSQS